MFIINAKMYNDFMNLLLLYVSTLYYYVFMFPFRVCFSLFGCVSLVLIVRSESESESESEFYTTVSLLPVSSYWRQVP
jgi:hypothetical protein